jgi:molecular chaperone DnaK (HSP70)
VAQKWALDLGTTNSVVAMEDGGSVRVVPLSGLGRTLPVDQSPLIPSAVHVYDAPEKILWFFNRNRRHTLIGQQALSRNFDGHSPAFAQGFKRALALEPHRIMLRVGQREEYSAREVARSFLREMLRAIQQQFHEKLTDLTIPSPVGYYEQYRAEVQAIARSLGIKRFRSLDEPVAAALGYGVNIAREETLLVVDFGGGTLNLAAVRLGEQAATTGKADVIAKHMVNVGGDDVDRWLVEHFLRAGMNELPDWQRDVLWEAMFVKERVSRGETAEFKWGGIRRTMDRGELVRLLSEKSLYDQLKIALRDIQTQLREQGASIEEVLLVGGSTQLPEVAAVVDDAFPEAVVRHDPAYIFTSVALGAARYASGTLLDDFVYHDYALAVQNEQTRTVDYELLVPRKTRYPTSPEFTVRYYADYPGMSEMRFSICEIGRLGQEPVAWERRANGNLYWSPATPEQRNLIVELNPADAALPLRPPGQGASARMRVTYFVNEDRWLCTTVEDLVRKQPLRIAEPVVRLR